MSSQIDPPQAWNLRNHKHSTQVKNLHHGREWNSHLLEFVQEHLSPPSVLHPMPISAEASLQRTRTHSARIHKPLSANNYRTLILNKETKLRSSQLISSQIAPPQISNLKDHNCSTPLKNLLWPAVNLTCFENNIQDLPPPSILHRSLITSAESSDVSSSNMQSFKPTLRNTTQELAMTGSKSHMI